MALLLDVGEVVAAPPTGKRALRLNDDGSVTVVAPDGSEDTLSSGASEWLNTAQFYVSAEGSDTADGTGETTPKQTVYAGLQALSDAGGGTLNIGPGCLVGGPVPGQGIWLRYDNTPGAGSFVDVPGFVAITGAMHIKGGGNLNADISFFSGLQAGFTAGEGEFLGQSFLPPFWVVGANQMPTVIIEGLKPINNDYWGAMIGVDYERKLSDGSLRHCAITNATRTGTETVFTVTLPEALTVETASRTDDVTTLVLTNPGYAWQPFKTGCYVRVSSDTVEFPDGDYQITATSNGINQNTTWSISYADVGDDVAEMAVDITFQTHSICAGELLDLANITNVNFLETQYLANSVTADTVTVTDIFGSGDADEDDIGDLIHQERFYCGTTNTQIVNCGVNIANNTDYGRSSWTFGHTQAIPPYMERSFVSGFVGDGTQPRDERRMAAVYVYPGHVADYGPAGTALWMRRCTGINGSVYAETDTNGLGMIDCRDVLIETSGAYAALNLPVLRVDGNQFTSVYGDLLFNADAGASAPAVVLNGNIPWSGAWFDRCGFGQINGRCIGGDRWLEPGAWTGQTGPQTPWQRQHVTNWADGRITGQHPAAIRALGPVAARFQNWMDYADDWLPNAGITVNDSGKVLGPFGAVDADLVEAADAGNVIIRQAASTGSTFEVGGRVAVRGWINLASGSDIPPLAFMAIDSASGITFDTDVLQLGYSGDGWQVFRGVFVVETVTFADPNISLSISFNAGASVAFAGMTAEYIPVAISDNDAYEHIWNARPQAIYMAPGDTGTMEGQKFIADGGIGTNVDNTYVAGAGAGELTLTGSGTIYLPVYDRDGVTVLGYTALLQATVNP